MLAFLPQLADIFVRESFIVWADNSGIEKKILDYHYVYVAQSVFEDIIIKSVSET